MQLLTIDGETSYELLTDDKAHRRQEMKSNSPKIHFLVSLAPYYFFNSL
jgi:hypothetical protein